MENPSGKAATDHIECIVSFIGKSSGLEVVSNSLDKVQIFQKTDGKVLTLIPRDIEEIISRIDSSNQPFLQVNFLNGRKLLLTENLVGFKPAEMMNLDMGKLPKVVTTPDLISVVEAIEESLNLPETHPEEIKILQRVYDSVLKGAEDIGFDIANEKTWIKTITNTRLKPSA